MSAKTQKDIRRTRYIHQLEEDLTKLTKVVSDLMDEHRKLKGAAFDALKQLEERLKVEKELRQAIIVQERNTASTNLLNLREVLDSITQADNAARKEFAAEFLEFRRDINTRSNVHHAFLRLPWYKRLFGRI